MKNGARAWYKFLGHFTTVFTRRDKSYFISPLLSFHHIFDTTLRFRLQLGALTIVRPFRGLLDLRFLWERLFSLD
jgi:hypothetical protein